MLGVILVTVPIISVVIETYRAEMLPFSPVVLNKNKAQTLRKKYFHFGENYRYYC